MPNDGHSLAARTVLLAEYTENAMLLHLQGLNRAVDLSWLNMYLDLHFDLGSYRTPDEQDIRATSSVPPLTRD